MTVRHLSVHSRPHVAVASATAPAVETVEPVESAPPTTSHTAVPQPKGEHGSPAFWPRKLLDVGPTPLAPIVLPSPEGDAGAQVQGHAILELFIDAHGRVEHIDVLTSDAPPDFMDAVQTRFKTTPFTPGIKDNIPVPSRIKIEVRYE